MNNMHIPMRGLYKRGEIYWIAYKAVGGIQRLRNRPEPTTADWRKLSWQKDEPRSSRAGGPDDCATPKHPSRRPFKNSWPLFQPRKVSWSDDRLILERFARFLGPNACLQDIDRRLVERFQLDLLSRGISKARVNRYTATLKCFFNRFIDWENLQLNPCKGIKLYPETPRTHWLEAGQIMQLLDGCSPRLRPVVQIALLTGLRIGDILDYLGPH